MVTSIRLQQLAALTETDCWGNTGSSITQPAAAAAAAASPYTWPQTNKLTGVKWALRASHQSRLLLLFTSHQLHSVLYCTSRVGAGVDGQVLSYPPQDLLLRLSPIFTLQQLFVRVGQVKLCRAKHRWHNKQHKWFINSLSLSSSVYF